MKRRLPLTLFAMLLAFVCGALRAEEHVNLRETVNAYPELDGLKILCVKRAMPKPGKRGLRINAFKSLGFPSNHECQSAVRKTGYDNEIGILDLSTGEYSTLYRPGGGSFVGHINLHWSAQKFLFTQSDETNYQIFELNIDGTGLRQVSHMPDDVDCFEPCYLPDGRIIVNSNAPYQSVPCWHGTEQKFVSNLYVMDANGVNMRRLTFDQDIDFHPSVRHNGQIVYSRWDYTGINRIFLRPVMSMNPDGTSQKALYGSNSWFPSGLYYPKELPGQDGRFLCVLAGYHGSFRSGTLAVIDINKGTQEYEGFVCQINGADQKIVPQYKDGMSGNVWPQFCTPTPVTDRVYVASAWNRTTDRHIGIYVADITDNVSLLHAEDEFAFLEPIPLIKRVQPAVQPDRIDHDSTEASVYIQDVYLGPGLKEVPRGTVRRLRVIGYDFGYIGLAGNDIIGQSGPWDAMRIIGTVPVEEDGSATFKVPANTPLAFQALDTEGKAVQLMRTWVTAMPGETMSCVGCHEPADETPRVKRTIASVRSPRTLDPWYGPARGFDFAREVQPVLNRYCVRCHDGEHKLDLRSEEHFPDYAGHLPGQANFKRMTEFHRQTFDNKVLYTPAYEALVPYIRRVNVGDDVSLLEPGEYHADTSPLVQLLQARHKGIRMDEESRSRLVTWIDLYGPCHGTWNDVYNVPIPQEPNRRRWELSQLYGAPAVNPDVIPETPDYDETPVTFELPPEESRVTIKPLSKRPTLEHKVINLGGGLSLRLVRFGEPYWMSACEISNAQFRQFDPDHTSRYYVKRLDTKGDDRGVMLDQPDQPALRVSWNRAMAFCQWLSEKTGMDVTLPTEAQWETACRAGNGNSLHYPDDDFSQWENMADKTFATVGRRCRPEQEHFTVEGMCVLVAEGVDFADQRFDDGAVVTMPVGSYKPNAFGLHDMHGNVAEWTLADFGDGEKTVKGGSFLDAPTRCRADLRLGYPPWQNVHNTGFRIVVNGEANGKLVKDEPTAEPVSSASKARLPHRLLVSTLRRIYTVDESGKVSWVYEHESQKNPVIFDAWPLPNGNVLFSHRYGVVELNAAREKVWEYNVKQEKLTEVHNCQPLPDGKVLVLECDKNRLFEIDRGKKIHNEIKLDGKNRGPHNRYGVARKTPEGTYLVPYVTEGKVAEFSVDGEIIREIKIPGLTKSYIWYAERLPNGNTLVSTGKDLRVVEVDPKGKVVWELRESDLPGMQLFCLMGIQRLPNGNTIVCNGDFHIEDLPRGEVMMLEVTPHKKVAWKLTRTEISKTLAPEGLDGPAVYSTSQARVIGKGTLGQQAADTQAMAARPAKTPAADLGKFARLDADRDGRVSREEYVASFAAGFDRKDADKDGLLTPSEHPHTGSFRYGDVDKDGRLTRDEYLKFFGRQFDRIHDADKDGFITGLEAGERQAR